MRQRMQYDGVAWERSDDVFTAWFSKLTEEDTFREVGSFIAEHRRGIPVMLHYPIQGAFNVCVRMEFEDGGSALIRFPSPGYVMFPEEKVRNEVAIMRYLSDKTSIPVPFILHHGTKDESPQGLGPFIIMDYVKHEYDMVDAIYKRTDNPSDRPILDEEIAEEKLERMYGQMADVLLELSKCNFTKIGSPLETDDEWTVNHRPITLNMNELVELANFPRQELPADTFSTSSEYFAAVAQLQVQHLSFQRNDAVDSEEDCRRKYIARQLFCKLVAEHRLESDTGPFKLVCDDFRPANVLLGGDEKIVVVLDWEFSYAAPAEFAFSPPWWLLIERPEYWPHGLEDWAATYERRLPVFLRALEAKEQERIKLGRLDPSQVLSTRMRRNWDNGMFWVTYAASRSWAFDSIFWNIMIERFFGCATMEEALVLLTEEAREALEPFVERKMEEAKSRQLVDWDAV